MMQDLPVRPDTPEKFEKAVDRFMDLVARHRGGASPGATSAEDDALGLLAEIGIDVPDGVEAKIVANTPEIVHIVLPPDPNAELVDEDLDMVAGGKGTAGTVGSAVGSFGSMATSTAPSSLGSASTAGTVGTAS